MAHLHLLKHEHGTLAPFEGKRFDFMVMTPSSQRLYPPQKPGRFSKVRQLGAWRLWSEQSDWSVALVPQRVKMCFDILIQTVTVIFIYLFGHVDNSSTSFRVITLRIAATLSGLGGMIGIWKSLDFVRLYLHNGLFRHSWRRSVHV